MSKDKKKQINAAAIEKKRREEAEKVADEQLKKCTPVIFNIMRVIAENEPKVDVQSREEFVQEYQKVTTDCLVLLKDADLTITEIEFTLPKVEQMFGAIKAQILTSLNVSSDKVLEKKFGKEFSDCTMSEWDDILSDGEEKVDDQK